MRAAVRACVRKQFEHSIIFEVLHFYNVPNIKGEVEAIVNVQVHHQDQWILL